MGDTIAAISTAPQSAAIGVIRLSGDRAAEIARGVFSSASPLSDRRAVLGKIKDAGGNTLDEAICTVFLGPRSYTGEDMAEFSCHGGTVVLRTVLEALCEAGARPAEKGEFTKRAFLNGKLDLSQSEAIIDIITAGSPLSAREALSRASGSLRRSIEALQSMLLDADARVMAYIDFVFEGIEPPNSGELIGMLEPALEQVAALAESYKAGRAIREGFPVALCGKPNVGKSALMNALLGENRSIVTDEAGTTRDVVSETLWLDGLAVLLSDTAGLRETASAAEAQGVMRARRAAEESGLLLCVFDSSLPPDENDFKLVSLARGKSAIAVLNKSDLTAAGAFEPPADVFEKALRVSAKTGQGIPELLEAIKGTAWGALPASPDSLITTVRQKHALDEAARALERAIAALKSGVDPETAELDISAALECLGLITGDTVRDDMIERIFENFCVGK